jgi:hypothetical protein
MMDEAENALVTAERYAREIEEIVDRQVALVEKLEAAGDHEGAKQARKLLALFVINMEFARDRLPHERDAHGTEL